MQHLITKAAVTAQDQGVFSALAATYSIDRDNERIVKGAFEGTITDWQQSGKMLPLHWNHSGSAEDIIGSVNPATMQETEDGLYVEGKLDLENSDVAKEAWRSMKNSAVSLSFGFLATATAHNGDVTELKEIDLFEISIVPAPANPDTRFLSLKALQEEGTDLDTIREYVADKFPDFEVTEKTSSQKSGLRKQSLDLALEVANDFKSPQKVEPEPATEPEPIDSAELRRRSERAVVDAALL